MAPRSAIFAEAMSLDSPFLSTLTGNGQTLGMSAARNSLGSPTANILGGRGGQWGEMKLFEIDPDTGESHELIELPATFDSSYPGIVYHEGLLWVSYYTSSDGATEGGRYRVPTEIRLAKIKLSE